MRHRVTGAILLLYPRRVRKRHGPEIVALIDDLIAHEGRSRSGLFIRLAVDGLVQRVASTATVWTVVAVLAATSFGGLAVSDFAAANATRQGVARTVHTVAPRCHTHRPQAMDRRLADDRHQSGPSAPRSRAGHARSAPRAIPTHRWTPESTSRC
jgi:hypothetical protein